MRFYHVSAQHVEACLEHPTTTTPSNGEKVNYWLVLPEYTLRVTAVEEDQRFVIITVTPKDRLPAEAQP